MSVERFQPSLMGTREDYADCIPHDEGDFVRHSDYATLEAKLAEAERQKQEIARTALSLDGECQALMADIARERARAEAAESRVKAMEADLRDEQGHVKRLQKALAFWMPGVSPEIEEELNGRAGDDACLLAGYDGEHEEECWGDTMVSRVKALEGYVTNCCVCGRIVDKREADDGGDPFGCELPDGRWTCSFECWDASTPALSPVEAK